MADVTQLSDKFVFDSSLVDEPSISVSKKKTVVNVVDQNQGSYTSGLITIDATNQLNGANGYASLREAYITIPYIVSIRNIGSAALATAPNRFIISPKCGVWNFISDLEVELNGKQILTTNQYKSFWNNLRAMTEVDISDLHKHGADTFLTPDDWFSINFSNSASTNGDGYSNNSVDINAPYDQTLGQTQENRSFNRGLAERMNNNPAPLDGVDHASFGWGSMQAGASTQIQQQSGRSSWVEWVNPSGNRTTLGNISGVWIHMLKIRLIDLHPLFKQLDLISNPQIKIRYRVNAGTSEVLSTGANQYRLASTTLTSGTVCPIILAGASTAAHPMHGVFSAATQGLSISYGALGNAHTTTAAISQFLPYTTTRLHIPFYDLTNPLAIVKAPVKSVRYLDCFAQYFKQHAGVGVLNTQQNATFNFQLSASLKNVKYIALLPFAETSAGHWATAHGTEQFMSPFDSAPWTVQPGSYVRNFQVQIGNTNVFSKTHEYDYESFLDEFSKLGAINGGVDRLMNSGLVNLSQWSFAQRVMIADCSRLTSKDVPTSIQISGTNACSQGTNFLVFAVYERELTFDRLTGEVIEFSS